LIIWQWLTFLSHSVYGLRITAVGYKNFQISAGVLWQWRQYCHCASCIYRLVTDVHACLSLSRWRLAMSATLASW